MNVIDAVVELAYTLADAWIAADLDRRLSEWWWTVAHPAVVDAPKLSDRQVVILDLARASERITSADARRVCPYWSAETLRLDLAGLVDAGLLARNGYGRGTFYTPTAYLDGRARRVDADVGAQTEAIAGVAPTGAGRTMEGTGKIIQFDELRPQAQGELSCVLRINLCVKLRPQAQGELMTITLEVINDLTLDVASDHVAIDRASGGRVRIEAAEIRPLIEALSEATELLVEATLERLKERSGGGAGEAGGEHYR